MDQYFSAEIVTILTQVARGPGRKVGYHSPRRPAVLARILIVLALFLPVQAQLTPKQWAEDFYQRYNALRTQEESLSEVFTAHSGDLTSELHKELMRVVKHDGPGKGFLLDFDPFTSAYGNNVAVSIKGSGGSASNAWVSLESRFQGVRGPRTQPMKLFLVRSGQSWKIANIAYPEWPTAQKDLRAILTEIWRNTFSVRAMTEGELAASRSDSSRLIPAHCFVFKGRRHYGDQFVAFTSKTSGLADLGFSWRKHGEKTSRSLPVGEADSGWTFWELKAVAFGDYNKDGLGPDVLTVAEYITGAGPEAAVPFPVTRVYFRQPSDEFQAGREWNEPFDQQQIDTVDKALQLLEKHF